jgi:hypothetical protein
MKDKMHIEVQVANGGDDDVYIWDGIFCWGQGGALNIRALTSAGKQVHPASDFLLDCVPPPPKEGDLTQFIRIGPGRFYGLTGDFDLRDLVDGPGERTLVIRLGGVLSLEFIRTLGYPELPYWTSEDKPLISEVHLTITP